MLASMSSLLCFATASRHHFLKVTWGVILGAALGWGLTNTACAAPPRPENVLSPDAALKRLQEGNRRYVKGTGRHQNFQAERAALALSQNPFAGILSCADSRVTPEFAFDTGRGDLFVCRVAGNFADTDTIASFEYGVAVLDVPCILVLGHAGCGAVDSTIKAVKKGAKFPGHIPSLIRALKPSVQATLNHPGNLLANATAENVRRTVQKLRSTNPILRKAIEDGKLKIVGGVYHLNTGRVEMVE